MKPAAAIIVIEKLSKRFPVARRMREMVVHPFREHWRTVLDRVELQIQPGEVFGVLVPNGAGKTTLVKILCSLLLPDEGRASINGYDVVESSSEARRAIGYCLDNQSS